MQLRHERICPWYPYRKLTILEERELRDWRIARNAERIPTLDELAASVEAHPAGKHLRLVDDSDYMDAHFDDDDDVETF
jgi:hypothetical protein